MDTITEEKKLILCNENIVLSPSEKEAMIEEAAEHYGRFLTALKHDWRSDPNASDTPRRVAKSFVNDLIEGCYSDAPKLTDFNNEGDFAYDGLVFQGNIELNSICAHHHLPFIGKAHVAYIPKAGGKVMGLSKLNRVVEFFARRPQIQENLTMQVHGFFDKVLEGNLGVAVMCEANHLCACQRGVKHDSTMITSKLSGVFMDNANLARSEFYNFVNKLGQK